ncbi:hypothetical protein CEQ90_00700 [Lewinellaceae bacterium SD302]|nr:hypothetical protein CEQ90_00700 [Lewinellaceae bacterium SD302]
MKLFLIFLAALAVSGALTAQNFVEAPQSFIQVGASSIAFGNVRNLPSGNSDLFISGRNDSGDVVSILYGNTGGGTFSSFPVSGIPAFSNGTAIFGDVDSDGDDDIYISGITEDFSDGLGNLYFNDGNGFFSALSPSPFRELQRSAAAFINPDNDNTVDVITLGNEPSEPAGRTDFYANINNSEFLEAVAFPLDDLKTGAVAVTDVDGDGNEDVMITGSNEANGSSLEFVSKLYRYDGLGNYVEVVGNPFIGVIHSSLDFADVDNDGDQDVFITGTQINGAETARLYYHVSNGQYEEAMNQPFTGVEYGASEFADIDGDGDVDLIVTGQMPGDDPYTQLFLNDGAGNFSELDNNLQDVYFSAVAFNDVDGDGDQDLLISGFIDDDNVFTRLYLNEPFAGNICEDGQSVNTLFGGPVNEVQTLDGLNNIGYGSIGDPENNCFQFDGIDASRWFTFTGDGEAYRIVVPNCGSPNGLENEDSQIILYSGDCNNLTEVACNDDEFPAINFVAGITFSTEPGVTYRFFVDGYGGGFTGGGVGNPEGEFCLEVIRQEPSSVTDKVAVPIELYPNPASDWLTFNLGGMYISNDASLVIRDLNGRKIWEGHPSGTQMTVNTAGFAAGVYTVELYSGKYRAVSKLVIN